MSEEIVGVSRIELKFDTSALVRSKKFYANGRMQVRVLVSVVGMDSEGDAVSFHGHPALETLRLISYDTAAPLDGFWHVSKEENRYAHDMAGGIPRVTPLVPAAQNRLSDPSEPVQVFEFWVTSQRPGSLEIAAEISLEGVRYRSNGRAGRDSSITLEAIPPKQYPVASFMLTRSRSLARPSSFETFEQYGLGLYAEGRQIHLLDWSSIQVKYDAEYATEFFSSGDATKVSPGLRSYRGYIAPVYGKQVSARTPTGIRTVAQDLGTISILNYITSDYPNQSPRVESLDLKVVDEFGTEHGVRINPDIANRSYTLS